MIAYLYCEAYEQVGIVEAVMEVADDLLVIKSGDALIDIPLEYVYKLLKEADERRKNQK